MKTNEFIKRVEELGYKAHKIATQIDIIANGFTIARVYTNRMYAMNAFTFINIEWRNQDKLFDLIVEYAKTPIEDREEEKKYYLRHRWMTTPGGFPKGLRINIDTGTADVELMIPMIGYKNQFTLEEIEEIKEKFNTNLGDFKKTEVEE